MKEDITKELLPKKIASPRSALGEAIGKLIEIEISQAVKQVAEKYNLYTDIGGRRPDKRRGVKLSMINSSGNEYQLDTVVEDKQGKPLITVESKYLRYKKHNRDKASWTCTALYSLRKTYPTIRKSIAVLCGNWSKPSKALLKTFGVEVHEVPFSKIVNVLKEYKIKFDWDEKDRETAKRAWKTFASLNKIEILSIAKKLTSDIIPAIKKSVEHTITADPNKAKEIAEVEVLIKTNHEEYFTATFPAVHQAMEYLFKLQTDKRDVRDVLR